jgi:hypothetical protein
VLDPGRTQAKAAPSRGRLLSRRELVRCQGGRTLIDSRPFRLTRSEGTTRP